MDFLFVDKPSGVTTHTSHGGEARNGTSRVLTESNDGFVEYLSARINENAGFWQSQNSLKLFVTHRLDRNTTGAICFARTQIAAEKLRQTFVQHEVKKRYLFLTDKIPRARAGRNPGAANSHASPPDSSLNSSLNSFEVESFIERRDSVIVSEKPTRDRPANARTKLTKLDESDGIALWEALPATGKSHQIRLHAQDSGIAILGDSQHGGSDFPTLCLHSEQISFQCDQSNYVFTSPAPRWFLKRSLTTDTRLALWLASIDRRERLLRSWANADNQVLVNPFPQNTPKSNRSLRWIHSEGDPLRIEQLGSIYSLSWFSDNPPTREERCSIDMLLQELGWENWILRLRRDRGGSTGKTGQARTEASEELETSLKQPPPRWHGQESDLNFEFRSDQGLSMGLFLDQRRNRAWVHANSQGKSVLNLFSYTGGFSVAAAKGGAIKTVSVDLSRQFLAWTKENFSLNKIAVEGHEFRSIDSREYLNWAKKKALSFDLVICDPPSFSRSDSGIFKIEQALESLIIDLINVTKVGGRVLFSTNYEGWTEEMLEAKLRQIIPKDCTLLSTPSPDWDFELPNRPRNMKSVFIMK